MEFEKALTQPYAEITLKKFLEKEDFNFQKFFEMQPFEQKGNIYFEEHTLPIGFIEDATNKRFYARPKERLEHERNDATSTANFWKECEQILRQIAHDKNRTSEEIQEFILDELDAQMTQQRIRNYEINESSKYYKQRIYFSNILKSTYTICPKNVFPLTAVEDMDFRDEVYRHMFRNQKRYDAFFNEYIEYKYEGKILALNMNQIYHDLFNAYVPHTSQTQKLNITHNILQHRLDTFELEQAEGLERELMKERGKIRIFNTKFTSPDKELQLALVEKYK